jgi:hypothetical protein
MGCMGKHLQVVKQTRIITNFAILRAILLAMLRGNAEIRETIGGWHDMQDNPRNYPKNVAHSGIDRAYG